MPLYNVAPNPSGGDDTAALQAAINSTPDGGCLAFPANSVYQAGTLKLYSRTAVRLVSFGGTDLASLSGSGTVFHYIGPAGALAMIDVNWSHRCSIEGIRLDMSGPTFPTCGVSVDEWPDPTQAAHTTVCSQFQLLRCVVALPGKSGCDGMWISKQSKTNCEFTEVRDCIFQPFNNTPGMGSGVVQWASFNAKLLRIIRSGFSYLTNGVQIYEGGCLVEGCWGTGNAADVRISGLSDVLTVRDCRFEQSGIGITCDPLEIPQDSAIMVEGNVWGSITGPYCAYIPGRQVMFRGNKFQPANPQTPPAMFQPQLPTAGGSLWWVGNLLTDRIADNSSQAYQNVTSAMNWGRSY